MALVAACSVPITPGEPSLTMNGPWTQGAPRTASLAWPNFYQCGDDDWTCAPRSSDTTMTVLSLACQGCNVIDDPTGSSFVNGTDVRAIATTDGPITLDASIRFDPTGATRQLSATAMGDHEIALEATCGLVDSTALAQALKSEGGFVAAADVRDCASTRLATDTVVIAPAIRSYHGEFRFPFCSDHQSPCEGPDWHEQRRPRSSIQMTLAPTDWGGSNGFPAFYFAALPDPGATQSLTLSTALATGEIVTTSVAIPPLAPGP
jgi:hypothetical protein